MSNRLFILWIMVFIFTSMTFADYANAISRSLAVSTGRIYYVEATYTSANGSDYPKLQDNVYHPNYTLCSPGYSELYYAFVIVYGVVFPSEWTGMPYCYGRTDSPLTVEVRLEDGNGAGASPAQNSANGGDVSWSTGIDCAEFVAHCAGFWETSVGTLYNETAEATWANIEVGDLIFNATLTHVVMFAGWNGYLLSCQVLHASSGQARVVEDEFTYNGLVTQGWIPRDWEYRYSMTPVEDIGWFVKKPESTCNLPTMEYHITSADTLALYMCDNPYGPARFVKKWWPTSMDGEVSFLDACHPYDDSYYFFLNHGPDGGYPCSWYDMLGTDYDELFPNQHNPIDKCGPLSDRPELDPPGNLVVSDVPLDRGEKIHLTWDLSDDDQSIDWYNVYAGTAGNEKWRMNLAPGTDSCQILVLPEQNYRFFVSSAHGTACDIDGIWNDISSYVEGSSIDNFAQRNLSLNCADTLFVSPDTLGTLGFKEIISLSLAVLGSDDSPTASIPADSIEFFLYPTDSIYVCVGNTINASDATDEYGVTELDIVRVGGLGLVGIRAKVDYKEDLYSDYVFVTLKSPDINADGAVDLIDNALISLVFSSSCGQEKYNVMLDYNGDCAIDIIDYVMFSDHYLGTCSN